MTKKIIAVVFTAALLLLMLLPLAGLPVFGSGEPAANEHLSAQPVLLKSARLNENYLNELSDYFADHFALRREAATLWAQLNAALLRCSAEKQLILGSDGWLFYRDTMEDYAGVSLTDGALREAARDLRLMQDALAAQEKGFLFVIAPNKNSLYPEHMPTRVVPAHENSNAAKLLPLLREQGVRFTDLFAAFGAQSDTLYYRTDSHWTARGAALAADSILASLEKPSAFFAQDFSTPFEHQGDLYVMLYPRGRETEEDLNYSAGFAFRSLNNAKGGEALSIRTENDAAEGALFCWRDSFGVSLYPYLAESFGSAVFSRSATYDVTSSEAQGADVLVLELVERNLPQLWASPAVYPAPERAPLAAMSVDDTLPAVVESIGSSGLERWTLSFPVSRRDAGSDVFFAADGVWYAAAVQAGEDAYSVSVTACLPVSAPVEGLVFTSGGVLMMLPCEVGGGIG